MCTSLTTRHCLFTSFDAFSSPAAAGRNHELHLPSTTSPPPSTQPTLIISSIHSRLLHLDHHFYLSSKTTFVLDNIHLELSRLKLPYTPKQNYLKDSYNCITTSVLRSSAHPFIHIASVLGTTTSTGGTLLLMSNHLRSFLTHSHTARNTTFLHIS